MFASFQEKYALSNRGMKNVLLGTIWTTLTNLVIMGGTASLFLAMNAFIAHLTKGAPLPDVMPYLMGLLVFVLLLFGSYWFQYNHSYGAVFNQTSTQRIDLAERLRKLSLSFFGRRDLADLTDTILGDVATMEHAYAHALSQLYGAVVSSILVFLALLPVNWALDLAAFWSVPTAFAISAHDDSWKVPHDVRGRPRSGSATASRRRSTVSRRFAPPTRRTGIWIDSSRSLIPPKPPRSGPRLPMDSS